MGVEARPGIEPGYTALQAAASPLCHLAFGELPHCTRILLERIRYTKKASVNRGFSKFGAGNETRTRDPNLGKVVLYQLSYSRTPAC
jgi:hypothetical protein